LPSTFIKWNPSIVLICCRFAEASSADDGGGVGVFAAVAAAWGVDGAKMKKMFSIQEKNDIFLLSTSLGGFI
jgi:hypothetical protein